MAADASDDSDMPPGKNNGAGKCAMMSEVFTRLLHRENLLKVKRVALGRRKGLVAKQR